MSISGLPGKTGCERRLASRPVRGSVKSWNSGKVTGEVRVQPRDGQSRERVSRDDLLGGLREERERVGGRERLFGGSSLPETITSCSRGTAISSSV